MKDRLKPIGVIRELDAQSRQPDMAHSKFHNLMKAVFTPGRIFVLIVVGGSAIFWMLIYLFFHGHAASK